DHAELLGERHAVQLDDRAGPEYVAEHLPEPEDREVVAPADVAADVEIAGPRVPAERVLVPGGCERRQVPAQPLVAAGADQVVGQERARLVHELAQVLAAPTVLVA